MFGLKQSRFEFFLVSQNMEYLTKKADILSCIQTDQSLLFLSFSMEKEQKRVRGLWKLNKSLPNDSDCVSHIKQVIKEAFSDAANLNDNFLPWDFIKGRL